MDKLKMHSPDLTQQNIDRIAELFPNVVTERLDNGGNPVRAIDFDLLCQELSDHIVEGPQERYQLDWPGKRAALFAANAPIAKTLRPVREESVDFDTTQNLFIEGDNLDALKLLQESYLGKVKLIYIDPPYNTGNDFVYEDDFAETTEEYLERSGQTDADGTRLVANTEANGRFHSDWLSMMYPRLRLSRALLADDGFLFVSIDDVEIASVRMICDEIFGSANFVCTIMWRRKREISNDTKNVATQGEYIVVYGRSPEAVLNVEPLSLDYIESSYRDPTPEFPDGKWRGVPLTVSKGLRGGGYDYTVTSPSGHSLSRTWAYPEAGFHRLVEQGRVYWGQDGTAVPQRVMYAHESKGQPTSNYWDSTSSNKEGKKAILSLFGDAVFDTAKPPALLQRIIRLSTDIDSIVLDFFAGSGTTAEAVMRANAEDGGTRSFILVQLAEESARGSVAQRHGFESISSLARERVRRAGAAVKTELAELGRTVDIGFRCLNVDTTNLVDVSRAPDDAAQDQIALYQNSIKNGRSSQDLLFQVVLDWGLELSLPIGSESISGCEVLSVDDGALIACFDSNVKLDVVREIAARSPLRAVFRDSAFATDADRINAEQIFAEVSPSTDVKVI